MSRSRNDASSRFSHLPRDTGASGQRYSSRQFRSIRKELLVMQADVERMELADAGAELRESLSGFSWVSWLLPRSFGVRGSRFASVLGRYPLVSSLASIVMAGAPRIGLLRNLKPLLKWGGTGLAAWEAWRAWQRASHSDKVSRTDEEQAGRRRR